MTQPVRSNTRSTRLQNAVYTLPRDWESLDQVLVPLVERVDPLNAATQLLVITPDVESTVGLVAGAFARLGVQGIDIIPATGAARTARLLRTDPARAVAGPPWVLRQLLATSALPLDSVRTVLFAWLDDIIEEGGEALKDLETVVSELPKDAYRTLVVRGVGTGGERFIERHLHHARRVGAAGSAMETRLPVSYVTTPRSARTAALRRILDELDPPSAMVLARDDRSEEEARTAVQQLGYRRADDVVRVSRADVPANTHTVIFYDLPPNAAPFELVAESRPTRVIVLVEPREIETLRRLTGGRATPLERAETAPRAKRADEMLQKEIREVLESGFGGREISSIAPLLGEYDGVEVAGALLRILERERERNARARAAPGAGGDRRERAHSRDAQRDSRPRTRGAETGSRPRPRAAEGEPRPRRGQEERRKPGFDRRRGPRQ